MKQVTAYRILLVFLPLWLIPFIGLPQDRLPQDQASETQPAGRSNAGASADTLSVRYDLSPVATEKPAQATNAQMGEDFPVWEILRPLIMLLAGFLLIYVIVLLLQLWADRSSKHRNTIVRSIPIVRVVGWALLILLFIITIFVPSDLTLLALWLSVGIALAFATQDLIKSFIGGIILLLEKPFLPGDRIDVGAYSGEVQHIGLRTTRILTADDSVLSVPNSELVNQRVNNANVGELNCQVVAELYLPLDINTIRVREIAFEAAHVSRYIFQEKPVAVFFINEVRHEKSWLKMRLKAHVMDLRYELDFRSEMTELVLRELIREGLLREVNSKQEIH